MNEIGFSAGGVSYRALELGTGPLALCLHGFPDSAYTWRYLMPELANAGFRAVAPFQRGYAPTEVPEDGLFQTGVLSRDANEIHEVLGGGSDSVLIGHDWGAPAAYGAANSAPQRWTKVIGLAVPPGTALGVSFVTNFEQLKRSWYMFFFQHGLSDFVVGQNELAFLGQLWSDWSPGFDSSVDLGHVRSSLGDPRNLAAALGYYRAALGDGVKDASLDAIQSAINDYPTQDMLYIHGVNDGCIGNEVAELSAESAPENIKYVYVQNAGHFVQLEQPKQVNQLIVDFIVRHTTQGTPVTFL
jgi:pimeloyl-ACP methyl ester carboxylesterase